MSRAYRELTGEMVRIPMLGAASSLNVACAVTVLLYEVQQQHQR